MQIRKLFSSSLLLLIALSMPAVADERTVDLALADLQGTPHRLADLRGKWVVVNFWATWCPPCLEEMPLLDKFHAKHKDTDAVVWGINYEDIAPQELLAFVAELKVSYPMFHGEEDLEKILEPLTGLPTTFLVNPKGQLVASVEGPITPESIEHFINQYPLQDATR